jgi:hypothetical protein
VPAVDARSYQAPEWEARAIPLDFRVIESEDARGIAASHGVVDTAHDLDVLLRHRREYLGIRNARGRGILEAWRHAGG